MGMVKPLLLTHYIHDQGCSWLTFPLLIAIVLVIVFRRRRQRSKSTEEIELDTHYSAISPRNQPKEENTHYSGIGLSSEDSKHFSAISSKSSTRSQALGEDPFAQLDDITVTEKLGDGNFGEVFKGGALLY